jgi:ribosome recycling factor
MKLSEISTIMLRASNVLVVNPFEESHKDSIIKSIESSKLDVQITIEGSSIVVTLGAIPDDMKSETMNKLKKLNDNASQQSKELRHTVIGELKKLEKILGKDEPKRIEKTILDGFDK